jgi:hypothetical protein
MTVCPTRWTRSNVHVDHPYREGETPSKNNITTKIFEQDVPSRTCHISSGRRTAGGMVTIGMSYKNRTAMVKDGNVGTVKRGPHQLSLSPEAIAHFKAKSNKNVTAGQARIVGWDDIKDNPPPQLKVSPIVATPHKSKDFRSILDLSFWLRLKNGGFSTLSMRQPSNQHLKEHLINSGMPSAISSTHLRRRMTMQKISWLNSTSKTASGAWIAR